MRYAHIRPQLMLLSLSVLSNCAQQGPQTTPPQMASSELQLTTTDSTKVIEILANPQTKPSSVTRLSVTPVKKGEHTLGLLSIGSEGGSQFSEISVCFNSRCDALLTPFTQLLLANPQAGNYTIRSRVCHEQDRCSAWTTTEYAQTEDIPQDLVELLQQKRSIHNEFLGAATQLYQSIQKFNCPTLAADRDTTLRLLSPQLITAAFTFYSESSKSSQGKLKKWYDSNTLLYSNVTGRKHATYTTTPQFAQDSAFSKDVFQIVQQLDYDHINQTVALNAHDSWQILSLWKERAGQKEATCQDPYYATTTRIFAKLGEDQQKLSQINSQLIKWESL